MRPPSLIKKSFAYQDNWVTKIDHDNTCQQYYGYSDCMWRRFAVFPSFLAGFLHLIHYCWRFRYGRWLYTMNWTIIIIETIVLTLAFTAMVLIPLVKNPVWWIADYPEDIQEEYFKTQERIPSKFFSPTVLLKKGMALLIALALLLVVVKLAGAYDFWSALGVGYGIWLFIDWYDCFFLDWVLFANMKKVRLPGTEHMDEAYHQKKYHFVQSCWGMLIGLIPCLIGAGLYAWLF